jgi:pyrroloquinoline quinone biosynthesis protein B
MADAAAAVPSATMPAAARFLATLGGLALGALALAGCATQSSSSIPPRDSPYALVLGSAQDAGLPQVGCRLACCETARRDPSLRRLAASLLIADPRSGRRWLVDATPDLREQVELARGHPPGRAADGPRPPLFEGLFLTHAHMGHVAGLLQLGREAYDARGLPVHASPALCELLAGNAPWRLLVDSGGLELRPLAPGGTVELAPDLSVTALAVPHRAEFSDTLAFVVRGPRRALLYLPDIDAWERWEPPLERALAGVDVALLDGTFFADDEVPGRDLAGVPHPRIKHTLARLASLPAGERRKVLFTHLNHTNPAARGDGEAAAAVLAAGMDVAREGLLLEL